VCLAPAFWPADHHAERGGAQHDRQRRFRGHGCDDDGVELRSRSLAAGASRAINNNNNNNNDNP
jgi:hypothetical protein